jgi:hypothetical protein
MLRHGDDQSGDARVTAPAATLLRRSATQFAAAQRLGRAAVAIILLTLPVGLHEATRGRL